MYEVTRDWQILLKFGQRQHIESFHREGLLYMNPSHYFSILEDDHVRADRFESTDQIQQPHDFAHIRVEAVDDGKVIWIKPEDLVGPVLFNFGRPDHNIFCMFAVGHPGDDFIVDERNFAFGDSFIIVLNTQAFIDRVCAAAVVAGFECQYGPIEYYDVNTHSGETGSFRKPSHFAYQQEFRFALSPGVKTPVRLTLGDLSDITSPIHALSDINTLVTWSTERSREADL
ncbi:hypothetical protein B0G81_2204 [Paraburkholderia sp. BL6665CI2N2]|uniref:hypothetical protein n=1 Tax=Paraburkholderia sp. BL6665CI2N2 TaxID=1938806 RepID=UPI0010661374|nr:hypothetical protein [Paraburkholderia sp. BL6665CI2N2]TDY21959.1 hypothetical protein B0G81_2204 [Paraburkholderia sp. BL6665CI2N2]